MNTSDDTLFVGVKGHVIAFRKRDGTQLWKTRLKAGFQVTDASFVTVLAETERLYVHTLGHLFCLDASTGEQLWSNELKGLASISLRLQSSASHHPHLRLWVSRSARPLPTAERRARQYDQGPHHPSSVASDELLRRPLHQIPLY